jgi:DNA-binding NarL/FixJ family response regulator
MISVLLVDDQLESPPNRGLSVRQLTVLQLICDGSSNSAIAARFGITVNTVKSTVPAS